MPDDDEYDPWDESPGPEDQALERAWAELDEGRPERALEELAAVDPDWPDRWIPEALALTDLGDLRGARASLQRLGEIGCEDDHPDRLWAEGRLLLAEWRIDEACSAFERLLAVERGAATLERLSLCHELLGDPETGDRLLAEACELDAQAFPAPPRLEPEEFEAVVQEAIEELPPQFQRPLETTEVIVEPLPAAWMVDLSDPAGTPPDLLGLFVGHSDLERTGEDSGVLPRRIFLFQRSLERSVRSRAELVLETRKTLFHEVGHMLGFDEDGVGGMGLE